MPLKKSSVGVEIEAKYLVPSEEDFRRLLDCAGALRTVRSHLNVYFDTLDLYLRKKGWAARLRFGEAGGVTFTLKARINKQAAKNGVLYAVELEQELDAVEVLSYLGNRVVPAGALSLSELPESVAGEIAKKELVMLSWCLTRRWVFQEQREPDLIADECEYPDGFRDYEIEVECDDTTKGRQRALRAAALAGVQIFPQRLTKYERAMLHRSNNEPPVFRVRPEVRQAER